MSALTFKVGGDTTGLGRATSQAKGMLSSLAKAGKRVALGGMFAGAAAGVVGLVKGIGGLRNAIDFGGELSDLASQTGIAVAELVVLQRALRDNGAAAADAGPLINKMQKGITDLGAGLSTQVRAFDRLGLSYAELERLSPGKQFEVIQKRISGMGDPTLRAATAMDVFGRSGAKLLAMFDDAGAIEKARVSVGDQAEILEKNAAAFDRASDLMAGMGDKFKGLFVGMAPFINGMLLPVLERINKIDLSAYGAAIGRFLAMIGEAFSQGAIPGMMRDGLLLAGKELINFLVKGFRGLVNVLLEALASIPRLFVGLVRLLGDGELWRGVGNILIGLGKKMALAFLSLIPSSLREGADMATDKDLKFFGQRARFDIFRGQQQIKHSDGVEKMARALGLTGAAVAEAFRKEMAGDGPMDTAAERGRLRGTMESLRKAVEENSQASDDAGAEKAKPGLLPEEREGMGARVMRPIVSSLGRIGGAALVGVRTEVLDKERNQLLQRIERNTRADSVAVFA